MIAYNIVPYSSRLSNQRSTHARLLPIRSAPGSQARREHVPDTEDEPLYLSLVHHKQGPSEPCHWSLYIARENQPGLEYRVTSNAEYMTYYPLTEPVDIKSSETFLNIYQLAATSEQQALVVKEIADHEPPRHAPNLQSVRENCQGWAVRVIIKLVEQKIVPNPKLQMARSMMEPI